MDAETAPLISSQVQELLAEKMVLSEWVSCFGSPLHVVFPAQASENCRQWADLLGRAYGSCRIQFALKSCKSSALLRAFAKAGAGADVSSTQEIMSAFLNMVSVRDMAMTGPAKTKHEMALCLKHAIAIHVDCIEELRRLLDVAGWAGDPGRLFLRLRPESEPRSRFGMTPDQIQECLGLLKVAGIAQVGYSFHVNDYEIPSRVRELRRCLQLARQSHAAGFRCCGIDIGGGFPVRYLASFDRDTYNNEHLWSGSSASGTYPYAAETHGPFHAATVVETVLADAAELAFLEAENIPILLQPGRSLLDQCGVTAFRVTELKARDENSQIAVLDGMSFSLSEIWFGSDFVPEPVVINVGERVPKTADLHTYLVGRSCLESDVIRKRSIRPANGISVGDLVVFVNTAGYQMDSNESTFHQIPLPRKLAAIRKSNGWAIHLDEQGSREE
ncbi:Diaminopimelate decarboxylase [Mycolicibacterium aubagnense]